MPFTFPAGSTTRRPAHGRLSLILWLIGWVLGLGIAPESPAADLLADGYHVYPGQSIQEAVDLAGRNPTNKMVKVHAGEYRPAAKRQALVWFNASHNGVRLEAVGAVTLTAANPALTSPRAEGYPAVVNHVVYFGHGVGSNTVIQGFRLTGANHFVSDKFTRQMEPDTVVPKNLFFYTDGGAIKVFGRSSPTLRNLEIVDNYASPCAGGISVQQEGLNQEPVVIENCIFRHNLAQVTGSAIDLLAGSAARIQNCLLTGNASNQGIDVVGERSGELHFTNSGVLTIFQHSVALVQNCTFAGNRNAVDDMGGASVYRNCVFVDNGMTNGLAGTQRYEMDLPAGARVTGCVFHSPLPDPRGVVRSAENLLQAPGPQFDSDFVPAAPEYRAAGYRPSPAPVSAVR